MSTTLNQCPRCGAFSEGTADGRCPYCLPRPSPSPEPRAWGVGPGVGLLVWGASVALLFVAQLAAILVYFGARILIGGERPSLTLTPPLVLATLGGTIVAHVLTLGVCWWAVTGGGKRPFREVLGWRWHTQFKWVHAVALAIGMTVVAVICERLLPHGETEFERLLMLAPTVRIGVALLAVLTAPLVEEVVYRGVLYPAFERAGRWQLGVVVVTLLFALVHVPQYWGSWAAITAILLLSLVLTMLRALTGQLLPCVATHFVFNAVQAAVLLAVPPKPEAPVAVPGLLRSAFDACGVIVWGG